MTDAETKAFNELKHRVATLEAAIEKLASATAPQLQLPKSPYAAGR